MGEGAARILITGANGHIGQQLVARLGSDESNGPDRSLRALVRSERAADAIRSVASAGAIDVVIGDYKSAESLRQAVGDADAIVHLVGIIKEGGGARYEAAHEDTCRVLAQVADAAGIRRIVYLSIFGSRADSANACLASKGRAEEILMGGKTPTTVLRVPMVLGPNDFASKALAAEARARLTLLVGGGATIQQPIDSRDVIAAVLAALDDPSNESMTLDLAGPERLSHRDLVKRTADVHGHGSALVVPVPVFVARAFARLMEWISDNPPITRTMLEILQHDDRIDQAAACERLGISLTPLDETLRHCAGPENAAS